MKPLTIEPLSLRVIPVLIQVPAHLIPCSDPGPPPLPPLRAAPAGRPSTLPINLAPGPPHEPQEFADLDAACAQLHRAQPEDQHAILTNIERESMRLSDVPMHVPLPNNLLVDLEASLGRLADLLPEADILIAVRIVRTVLSFLRRSSLPLLRGSGLLIRTPKAAFRRPPSAKQPGARPSSISVRSSNRFDGSCQEESLLQTFENLHLRLLYLFACQAVDVDQDFASHALTGLLEMGTVTGKVFAAAALFRLCLREDLRRMILNLPAVMDVLRFLRDLDDTAFTPLSVQLVGLLRLLADSPEFHDRFSVEEVSILLIQTLRVVPTYQTVVLNVYSFLALPPAQKVLPALFQEFGEKLIIILSLQILGMSRADSSVPICICDWLSAVIKRFEHVSFIASEISEPVDISICAEFLNPNSAPPVLKSVLHLIGGFSLNSICARILAQRREFASLLAKPSIVEDVDTCRLLLNVVERFTFHNQHYCPSKLVAALPSLLRAADVGILRCAVRIVHHIVNEKHSFLVDLGVPDLVVPLIASDDLVLSWLALRTIGQLALAFGEQVRDCWERMGGKQRVFEALEKPAMCRAQVIALVALIQMFPQFDREERARFRELVGQFEGYEAVKQLNDFIKGWCP
jgi:hypothetical protein